MAMLQVLQDMGRVWKGKGFKHSLGLCSIILAVYVLYDFENLKSAESYNVGSDVAGQLRRVLLFGNSDSPPAVPIGLKAHPVTRSTAYYQSRPNKALDFVVAGFPKCGTTTLLYAFAEHNETDIAVKEKCHILNAHVSDVVALHRLDDVISELSPEPRIKRAIKCPTGVRNARSIEKVQNHSPNARFIVGIRHPVNFLQSYYNYRVTEIHDKNSTEPIPSLESMVDEKEWKGVSSDLARFDVYLWQLGKTNMTTPNLEEFVTRSNVALRPNKFKVFLYTLDQMRDMDKKRNQWFRKEIQNFLQLESPLAPFGHENINNFVGKYAHPETVDICDSRYDGVREILVGHGQKMERWIREGFIKSPDVTVANEEHFLESIQSFGSDPCMKRLRGS